MAERIQARAIRRYGELLKQIEPGQGARDGKRHEGDLMPLNRTEAATQAGISERQKVTALRIANIPDHKFDALIESDNPPTITKLAELGKRQGQRTDLKVNEGQETLGGISRNLDEFPQGRTDEIAAKKAGFGNKDTYRQAKTVVENAEPELVAAMDAGTVAVSTAAFRRIVVLGCQHPLPSQLVVIVPEAGGDHASRPKFKIWRIISNFHPSVAMCC